MRVVGPSGMGTSSLRSYSTRQSRTDDSTVRSSTKRMRRRTRRSGPMTTTVAFDTTVTATGNNTGIVVPDNLIERLGAGRRPAVVVNVNGYEYRNTVGVMGGRHMIGISAAIRKDTGLKAGDPIHVVLTLADRPRE